MLKLEKQAFSRYPKRKSHWKKILRIQLLIFEYEKQSQVNLNIKLYINNLKLSILRLIIKYKSIIECFLYGYPTDVKINLKARLIISFIKDTTLIN